MKNKGKQFEERFEEDWIRTFPNSIILRVPDQMTGYKGTSKNICDFIEFDGNLLYFTECKTSKGASMSFDKMSQHEKLKSFVGKKNVRAGFVLWLYEKDIVYYIPASTITQLKADGKKSVGIRAYEEGYNIKVVPSKKLRVYMESDYSFMKDLKEGE